MKGKMKRQALAFLNLNMLEYSRNYADDVPVILMEGVLYA